MQCHSTCHKFHKLKAILLSTLIFVCGGISGATLYSAIAPKKPNIGRDDHSHSHNKDRDFPAFFSKIIAEKYGVSEENRLKIEQVFRNGTEKLNTLGEEMRPKVQAVYEQINKEVRQLIPEDQHALFDENLKKRAGKLPPIFFKRNGDKGHPNDGRDHDNPDKERRAPPPPPEKPNGGQRPPQGD